MLIEIRSQETSIQKNRNQTELLVCLECKYSSVEGCNATLRKNWIFLNPNCCYSHEHGESFPPLTVALCLLWSAFCSQFDHFVASLARFHRLIHMRAHNRAQYVSFSLSISLSLFFSLYLAFSLSLSCSVCLPVSQHTLTRRLDKSECKRFCRLPRTQAKPIVIVLRSFSLAKN